MRTLVLFLILSACNRPDEITDGKPDTGPEPDTATEPECSGDVECDDWEICEVGVCIDGDRNNAFEEAVALDWDSAVMGYLNPSQDWDYYTVTTDGGQFARISTRPTGSEVGEPEASDEMDTVVATYDVEGNLLSWEDDYPTGGSVSGSDSIVYTYFPDAGTYYVAVMDYTSAFDSDEKRGGADFSYVLTLQDYGDPPDESDSFASPGAEREVSEGYLYPVPVLLEEAGDSDWIELDLPYSDCPVLLRGSANLDGTDALPHVRLYTAEQEVVADLDELGTNGAAFYPDIDGGKAMIEALDTAGGGGANHWFFVIASVYKQTYSVTTEGVDMEVQVESEPNDELESSQLLSQVDVQTSGGSDYIAAHLWGTQDGEGDEDWYAFHAQAGWYIQAWGTADYNGSLMDPAIEIYDASGTLLTTWYDGSDAAPDLDDLLVETTGTHYMRVYDETGAAPGGAPYFYRFSIYVTDFTTN